MTIRNLNILILIHMLMHILNLALVQLLVQVINLNLRFSSSTSSSSSASSSSSTFTCQATDLPVNHATAVDDCSDEVGDARALVFSSLYAIRALVFSGLPFPHKIGLRGAIQL